LIINLAARAYELDKGHRPASLNDLVPDYLKTIPQDPSTGKNMDYSP
jgi:competence protein ComGC